MKVEKLLLARAEAKDNPRVGVESVIAKDTLFLTRSTEDLLRKIEDDEAKLLERLTSGVAIDKSVVEVLYREIYESKQTLELYYEFIEEFYA